MREAELRDLAGLGPTAEVTFMGDFYQIRDDGLAALIRFARATTTDNPEQTIPLDAIYRLLEDCLIDFGSFATRALSARAGIKEIGEVMDQLVAWYCARNHYPAMRLIGFIAGNMEEIDGQLIKAGGRGLAALSAREACNVALAICLEGRSEDDRTVFLEDLNYEGDPASEALAQLRQMQASQRKAQADG